MGCARDIVERCGVPRFLFSDFPLGNSAGRPGDAESQRTTLNLALDLFESATGPRTTSVNPLRWSEGDTWKRDFMNIEAMGKAELERRRAQFQAQKQQANRIKRGLG
jgi:hypothetical protein